MKFVRISRFSSEVDIIRMILFKAVRLETIGSVLLYSKDCKRPLQNVNHLNSSKGKGDNSLCPEVVILAQSTLLRLREEGLERGGVQGAEEGDQLREQARGLGPDVSPCDVTQLGQLGLGLAAGFLFAGGGVRMLEEDVGPLSHGGLADRHTCPPGMSTRLHG